MDIRFISSELLEEFYMSNKEDMKGLDYFATQFNNLFGMSCGDRFYQRLTHSSKLLYKILLKYFIIEENDKELSDIILDAVCNSNEYPTLQSLQDKINEIRKGE